MTGQSNIPARFWAGDLGEGNVEIEDRGVALEVEMEAATVAIHTMIDGTGSHASYYVDRESAIALAAEILRVVRLDA